MGANQSEYQSFPQSKYYQILDYRYCKVWKLIDNHQQTMEQYQISIQDQHQLNRYQKMWALRAHQSTTVKVLYFTHRDSKEICGLYKRGSLLTERIPYRLSQFYNIPYQQIMYVLAKSLQAFTILYHQYGLFLVRSSMIGLNFNNQIKVWHHTDYSAPLPQNGNCMNMAQMISSIIQSVQLNAEYPYQYQRFSTYYTIHRDQLYSDFNEALNLMTKYMTINRLPTRIKLLKLSKYLRQVQGWQQLSYNTNLTNYFSNINQIQSNSSQPRSFSQQNNNNNNQNLRQSRQTIKINYNHNRNIYTHQQIKPNQHNHHQVNHLRSLPVSYRKNEAQRSQSASKQLQPNHILSKKSSEISSSPYFIRRQSKIQSFDRSNSLDNLKIKRKFTFSNGPQGPLIPSANKNISGISSIQKIIKKSQLTNPPAYSQSYPSNKTQDKNLYNQQYYTLNNAKISIPINITPFKLTKKNPIIYFKPTQIMKNQLSIPNVNNYNIYYSRR